MATTYNNLYLDARRKLKAAGIPARFAAAKMAEGDTLIEKRLGLDENEREALEHIIRQMETVKEVWHKTEGRQARHFVVSFAWGERISEAEAWRLAYWIALYYADRYQIVYAVHEDTENVHIHFVFNPVSFVDGRIYAEGKDDFSRLQAHIWLEMNTGVWRERDKKPRKFMVNGKYFF